MEIGQLTILVWITACAFFSLIVVVLIGLSTKFLVNCNKRVKKESISHKIEESNFETTALKHNTSDILNLANGC